MKKLLPYLLMTILVCLTYGNTLQHSFHFDDIPSILEKPWIRGLDKIPDFIFSYSQRPLVILSFNINYAISKFEEWSYHVFNISFHLLVVVLVYRLSKLIASRMIRNTPSRINNFSQMPLLAALIFALHPLNTQAVTYISSRSSVMATIFYLAAILLFFEGYYKKNIKSCYLYIAFAFICFVSGLLCKLIIITLPAILFAFHYYFIAEQNIKIWITRQWKYILTTGVLLVLPILIYIKVSGSLLLRASVVDMTVLDYFRTQIGVLSLEYIRKMIFPFNLTIEPNFPLVSQWTSFIAISGVLILGILLIAWIKFSFVKEYSRKYSPEVFGLFWIAITLSPTSSFIPLLDTAAEHRTYLPLVGFSIAFASILVRLNYFFLESIKNNNPRITNKKKISVLITLSIFLILLSFLITTRDRNKVWKDEVSLWTDAKQKAPYHIRPYNNLGEAYDKLGKYELAIVEFATALRLNPDYFFALSNLGNIYGKKKNYAQAILYTKQALQKKPDYAPGHYNLAKALHMTGNPGQAMASYKAAIKYNPYFEEAFFNLGFLALELKQLTVAVSNFENFLKMQPTHPKAHFGMGTAYAMMGKKEEAKSYYESAIIYDPEFISPYINLANLNMSVGEIETAKKLLLTVLLKKPNLAGVHKNLGLILLQEKDIIGASKHLREYIRLMPLATDSKAIQSFLKNGISKD
jgi:tetratricopeptide (TPR) repeat protein